jgi:hypothetical protein
MILCGGNTMKRWMIVCAILVVGVVQVQGALVHRYAMSDPNDTMGTANATLVIRSPGTAGFLNGQLMMGNSGQTSDSGSGNYLELPNGTIKALGTAATFETWTTWTSGGMWARIFDFGVSNCGENSSCGADAAQYLFLTPNGGNTPMRFGMNQPTPIRVENVLDSSAGILTQNVEHHIVVTYDEATAVTRMYLNGAQVAQGVIPAGFTLAGLNDVNNWLGRAQWNDPMYGGSYNEFRIYNHAMNASEVAASLAAGTEESVVSPIVPVNGQIEVSRTPTLTWAAGMMPAGSTFQAYTLYFSKTLADVQNGASGAKINEFTTTSYVVANQLATDSTYYWRVDQRYKKSGATDPNTIVGGVFSFETIKTLPVLTGSTTAYGLLNGSANLSVNIQTASEVKSVAWYKYVDGTNDILLTAGSKYAMTGSNTLTMLTIGAVAAEDAGKYYAKVQNSAGTMASSQITFTVLKGLKHRYSFDAPSNPADPNVIDSVGGKNGILIKNIVNTTTGYSNGMLFLGNTGGQSSNAANGLTNGDYVDLPNGMISALGNLATFELWISWVGIPNQSWQRIFDFGTSEGGEGLSTGGGSTAYVMMTPRSGDTTLRVGYKHATLGERMLNLDSGPIPATNEVVHLALVWDGPSGKAKMYFNGKLVSQGDLHLALSNLVDNNNWLGRAQWGDPMFRGRYDEFRIYDVPLTDNQILAHFQAGPNVVGQDKPCTAYPTGDVNRDCKVDLNDLAAMAANWLICGGPICQ